MNITQFIQSHTTLSNLPFLVVYEVVRVLLDEGFINNEVKADVDQV
jgi:hypothetical protein